MSILGDSLESVDLRNFSYVKLEDLKISINPNNENELFFLTDAGMGYGDIIRVAYYARRIAQICHKKCKIVFTILDKTTKKHIYNDVQGREREDIVFDANEEIPKIAKVMSYFSKTLKDVDHMVVPLTMDEFSERAHSNLIPFLLPTRTLAVTNWLGVPYLRPNDKPEKGNHIAVWTTRHNLTPVADWKDPVGWKKMIELFRDLERAGHEIRPVSYRDDIEYVFETIRTAKFCIGYEGMGNLISQAYRKPCLVYSRNEYHSKVTSGMWAEVSSTYEIKHKYVTDMIREQEEIIHRGNPNKDKPVSNRDLEFFKRYL